MSEYRLSARLNENAQLEVSTDNLQDMAQALVFFNLVNPTQAPAPADGTVEPAPTPLAEKVAQAPAEEPKAKKPRAKKEELAASLTPPTPADASSDPAPAAATAGDEGNVTAAEPSAPASEPASSASSPAPAATPADAAEAVRGYGARHGIAAARELLQKFGFARTGDITADKAGELAQAAQA